MTVNELIEELRKYDGNMPTAVEIDHGNSYADIKVRHLKLNEIVLASSAIDVDVIVIGPIY